MGFLCHLSIVAIFAFVLAVSQGCNSLENTSFTLADKLIPPAPTSSAVRGEEHKIYCSKNGSYPTSGIISWYDILGSDSQIRLFDGFTKVTNDPKYFDFGIDYDYEYQAYSNLLIKDMAISKEGTYGCSLEDEMHLAKITMEVEASDLFIQTPDGNTPEVVEGIEDWIVQLTCKSVAARPALDLRWYQKKEDAMYTQITSGFQEVQSPNEQDSDTFDTTSDLRYNLHKTYHLGNLKCEASGQTAATLPTPDVLTLVVQWLPVVYITYDREGTQIICNADANPDVLPENYALIVDGNRYNGRQTLIIEITQKTEVTCEASNEVGLGEATIIVNEGLSTIKIVGIVIGVIVVLVVIVVVVFACCHCYKKKN